MEKAIEKIEQAIEAVRPFASAHPLTEPTKSKADLAFQALTGALLLLLGEKIAVKRVTFLD